MCRPICCIAAFLLLMAATLAAQTGVTDWETVKSLTTGTEVRIAIGSRTVRGDMIRATDDTLVVASKKGQETFAHQQVMDVSIRKSGHSGRNALLGLGIGAGAGFVTGLVAATQDKPGLGPDLSGAYAPVLAIVGGIVGSIVGAVFPTGGWREIYKK